MYKKIERFTQLPNLKLIIIPVKTNETSCLESSVYV